MGGRKVRSRISAVIKIIISDKSGSIDIYRMAHIIHDLLRTAHTLPQPYLIHDHPWGLIGHGQRPQGHRCRMVHLVFQFPIDK